MPMLRAHRSPTARATVLACALAAVAHPACSDDTPSPSGTTTTTSASSSSSTSQSASSAGGGGSSGEGGAGGAATGGGGAGGSSTGEGGGSAVPLDGFGEISGDCGLLDSMELLSSSSFYFRNSIDFGTATLDPTLLSEGGQEMLADGNLGGSSLYSEIFAYEVLYRCELARYLKSEGEIIYQNTSGKKTDILVSFDDLKVGVSVVRAYHYPPDQPYPVQEAYENLRGKLADILLSSQNVAPEDAWVKQVLHVIAYAPQHADAIEQAYATIDPAVRADTVVVVTVTEGADEFIY